MEILPFVPRLNGFNPSIADEVLTASFGTLPIAQRLDTHKPYDVSVSFILNGADHNELLEFWRDNASAYIQVKMTLEDSECKYYDCLIINGPTINMIGGQHEQWQPDEIIRGDQDVENCYYESTWSLIALVPHRRDTDIAIVEAYEFISDDMFVGYSVVT